jgi:Ca2+/Na+ antiporter
MLFVIAKVLVLAIVIVISFINLPTLSEMREGGWKSLLNIIVPASFVLLAFTINSWESLIVVVCTVIVVCYMVHRMAKENP